MNSIWRLCFTALLFVQARIVLAKVEDPMIKFHRDLTNFVSVGTLSESLLSKYVVILINL